MKQFKLLLIACAFTLQLSAQHTIRGMITDGNTNEPLIGATVMPKKGEAVVSGIDGSYQLMVSDSSLPIVFSYLGYQKYILRTVDFSTTETTINIQLVKSPSILNEVVVSGSRFERKIEEEATSIEVIKPDFIANNNISSLADIMQRVPGVQIMDEQVNIRSSGYSYGAGSRVGLVVDGQPLLGGLESDIKWNFIPVENIERVEVTKGASSVLYGSAAMNGVINVITARPTSKPFTSVSLYAGIMDDPKSDYRRWWEKDDKLLTIDSLRPYTWGVYVAHRQKIGKLDLVLGANVHKEQEVIRQVVDNRYRFNFSTKYHVSDRLNFGINGNVMRSETSNYFFWMDADTNALRPISFIIPDNYYSYSIDPHLTYYDKNDNKHTVRGRFFNFLLQRAPGDPDAPAILLNGEYQFQRKFSETLSLNAGVSTQYFYAEDPVYEIDTTKTSLVLGSGNIHSTYAQVDKSMMDNRLNLVLGIRGEYFDVRDAEPGFFPITRLGGTYKITPKNVLRANFGQGYRIPSLIERYIDIPIIELGPDVPIVQSINAIPNPNIRPERGWSAEIGFKKLIQSDNWNGYLDIAFFNAEYKDLTEFLFDFHCKDDSCSLANNADLLGFSMTNINRGRIGGFEVSSYLNGRIGVPFRFWGGYTFTYPGNLDSIDVRGMKYLPNMVTAFTMEASDTAMVKTILPYTSLHNARLDFEFYFGDRLTVGFVSNFNGYIHKIDDIFEEDNEYAKFIENPFVLGRPIIPGLYEYREESQGGAWVFDLRLGLNITDNHKVHFIINNLFNKEYAVRPGRMNPLRTFNIKYNMIF